tara:strand:- start:287 stop:715 length:429 start_codon:yes stop_codon:yes gene_type:complete
MEDSRYLKLKSKGIIDENDNVKFNGEFVPYYYLNEELTAFNPPRGPMSYQSDEWFYKFLKKHGRLKVNLNLKSKITNEIFRLIDGGKYKKRNLIKVLREKFPDASSGIICRLIKRKLDLRILEIDRTYKTKPYVIKGKYFIK